MVGLRVLCGSWLGVWDIEASLPTPMGPGEGSVHVMFRSGCGRFCNILDARWVVSLNDEMTN